ncbi:MAG TPA: hypothetical protein VK465_18695 [Fibrobacteria bacterium]|nr:hypothetical protein [Fibrobacteria bacterium]
MSINQYDTGAKSPGGNGLEAATGGDLLSLAADPRLANSPCWIFGSSRPLAEGDAETLGGLTAFMERWQAHGAPVAGLYGLVHDRFLVVVQAPGGASASGCSIDSLKTEIRSLEVALGTRLQDGGRIFYRGPGGAVESVTRAEFKALAVEGRIGPDTEVFDTTLTRFGDLRPGVFSKPLKDSWHLRLYEQARRAAPAA